MVFRSHRWQIVLSIWWWLRVVVYVSLVLWCHIWLEYSPFGRVHMYSFTHTIHTDNYTVHTLSIATLCFEGMLSTAGLITSHVYTCIRACTCTHACMHAHTRTHTYVYTHACTPHAQHKHTHARTQTHLYTDTHAHTCICCNILYRIQRKWGHTYLQIIA